MKRPDLHAIAEAEVFGELHPTVGVEGDGIAGATDGHIDRGDIDGVGVKMGR